MLDQSSSVNPLGLVFTHIFLPLVTLGSAPCPSSLFNLPQSAELFEDATPLHPSYTTTMNFSVHLHALQAQNYATGTGLLGSEPKRGCLGSWGTLILQFNLFKILHMYEINHASVNIFHFFENGVFKDEVLQLNNILGEVSDFICFLIKI